MASSHAREVYRELYPRSCIRADNGKWIYTGFKFSNRWFTGFLSRYRISLRCKTKRAQKSPEQLHSAIQNWLQFNRRNTVIRPDSDCGIPRGPDVKTVGRFKLSEISNMDQTPLPFEFNEGKTYAKKGDKTIWVKEQRSGWNKRQATLQLTVHADSKPHTKPLLMFRGQERLNTKARREEVARYPKGIHVIFNPKAYANGENLKQWALQQFKWGSPYSPSDKEPRLLVIDAFPAHKKNTDQKKAQDDFIAELKKLNTTVSMVPAGATGYVQVLDGFCNRKIKELISELEEIHYDLYEDQWKSGRFSVSDRRVLLTEWVLEAYNTLHERYGHLIVKAFEQVGLSLNPDGSKDWKLKIRDLPSTYALSFDLLS
jgi:hypothetical protein